MHARPNDRRLPAPLRQAAATVVKRCREHGVFLRNASVIGTQLGTHALRIAVKDAQTNERILAVLAGVLN